ncbi:MAG: hypothetical protein NW201_06325 [Gemmatimonadales bacterium]|nr:hypothetical protein [Gemmatimonadales bacterium]
MSRRAGPLALLVTALCAATSACRGAPPAGQARTASIAPLVDSLLPAVERAAGLRFRAKPRAVVRSREEVKAFLLRQFARDLPAARLRGLTGAYRLFGLLPDSLDLGALALQLYGDQVAGYWDHEAGVLVGVEGADAQQLRLVLAHELVHALQAQDVPVDSILRDRSDADRTAAAQAVLEGQATVAGVLAILPDTLTADAGFWDAYREQVVGAREASAALRAAPRVLRVGLLFPYLEGAEFMRWWRRTHGAAPPFGAAMPRSTEQILHPARSLDRDPPRALALQLRDAGGRTLEPLYSDVLGEFEVRLLSDEIAGTNLERAAVPLGWGGDRYALVATPGGDALAWAIAFDDAAARDRAGALITALGARTRAGYRSRIEFRDVGGLPAVVWLFAPTGAALEVAVTVR